MTADAYTAPDGAVIGWSIPCLECDRVDWCVKNYGQCTTPGRICEYATNGHLQAITAGRISQADLDRAVAAFMTAHSGQMALF